MSENKDVSIEALTDLCTPWCVFVVATLRIAEYIDNGNHQINQLAQAVDCDTYALHRVLTHLVGKGLFEETRPGLFTLNEASRGLLDPASRLGLDLEGIGGRMAYAWGTLLPYVKTGSPAYHQVFGLPFWEDLEAHPLVAASFDALIGPVGHGFPNPDFQIRGGWDSIKTVVDVGGGTGALLAGILQRHAHVRGILVDLPKAVARAAEIFQSFGIVDRVTAIGQSFFDPLPAGADIYLLRGILNDWPDPEALAILKRCAEAAGPAGRVVVLKSVSPDDEPRGIMIEMVLLGGKHRSLSEFRVLAQAAGLEISAAGQQTSGYFVVECLPG
jgi:2,7-dihydroxy-5-methyl-1-naphthoate 7-O-methyltransferase